MSLIKNGHICYPSYGGTHKKKKKSSSFFSKLKIAEGRGAIRSEYPGEKKPDSLPANRYHISGEKTQRPNMNVRTWQKSAHFSETAKYPFSLEHRKRRAQFMKSASVSKGFRPAMPTQKKFSGSSPSLIICIV